PMRTGSGRMACGGGSVGVLAPARVLRVVIGDDVLKPGGPTQGARRQQPRHDGALDTTGTEPTIRPVSGDGQIVIGHVQRRNPAAEIARRVDDVAIGWVDVRAPILRVETLRPARPFSAAAVARSEDLPPE